MKIIRRLLATLFIAGLMTVTGYPVIADAADYTTTYTYDDLGRPISVNIGGSTADFAYDAAGNRNVVSLSPGTTAPSVVVVSPPDSAAGISPDVTVAATFSRPVDPATVTTGSSGTFRLIGPGSVAVAGAVSVYGLEAVFVPGAPLQNNTLYTATITTGVKDLAGRALTQQKVWSFTIGAAPDLTKPTVLSTTPAAGGVGFPLSNPITALFSEALDPLSITRSSFLVLNGAYSVSANVEYNALTRVATMLPDAPLDPGVTYVAVLLSSITDLSGNRMAANKEWSFTTELTGLPVLPATDVLIPYDGETDLPLRTSVGAIFNKAMLQSTINTSTFTLTKGAVPVAGTVSYNPVKHQATFIPTDALDQETVHTATLTTAITDTVGVPLQNTVTWSFTTAPLPPVLVTCNLSGAGSGIVESTPPNFACSSESCYGNFPRNVAVLLHPVPYDTSLFAGWGAPCAGTGDCTFVPVGDTTLSAAFDLKPVRIYGAQSLYFTSLQAAYVETVTSDVIQVKAVTLVEDLTADGPKSVTFRGGYDAAYATNGGYGELKGKLTIKSGQVVLDRMVIK